MGGGSVTDPGSRVGAPIVSALRSGSRQMGWPSCFQEIIIGPVIIAAAFLDRLRRGARA